MYLYHMPLTIGFETSDASILPPFLLILNIWFLFIQNDSLWAIVLVVMARLKSRCDRECRPQMQVQVAAAVPLGFSGALAS